MDGCWRARIRMALEQVQAQFKALQATGWLQVGAGGLGVILIIIMLLGMRVGQNDCFGFWMMGKNDQCEDCRVEVDALRADGAALRCAIKRMVVVERDLKSELGYASERERHLRQQVHEMETKMGRLEKELAMFRRREEWELHTCVSTSSVQRQRSPSERYLLSLKPNLNSWDEDDSDFDMVCSPISPAPYSASQQGAFQSSRTTLSRMKKRRTAPFAMNRSPWANCEITSPKCTTLAIVDDAQRLVAHRH